MNSWLPSMCWPELPAMAREIETASVSASMVMISDGNSIVDRPWKEKSGIDSGGRPAGSAPTVRIPVMSTPKVALMPAANRLPATSATIM